MLASDIINRVSRILLDVARVRWTEAELIDYINDAQRQIVVHRPDANARNVSVALVAGTKQALPAGGVRFLRAVRNMGASGAKPGRSIRETTREALDSERVDWHSEAPNADGSVTHFVFDPVDPKRYYVYPQAKAGVQIEIVYSAAPATVTGTGDALALDDVFINPVIDWVLYRSLSKDADYAGNMARALQHMQSFANELGVELVASMSPPAARSAA